MIPLPSKKYSIIYADPPWLYNHNDLPETGLQAEYKTEKGKSSHYKSMPLEEIKKLPIANIAEENSILFLWATFPLLKEAIEVIESWDFTYKTLAFSWIKTNKRQDLNQVTFFPTEFIDYFFGIGYYTKSNCEVCLLATKGSGKSLVVSNSVSSVIIAPRRRHSQKPDEARAGIEKLVGPDVAKIELFARTQSPGWDVWGNEV
jgi:N6-adenosine-specific RNA methylase IME4